MGPRYSVVKALFRNNVVQFKRFYLRNAHQTKVVFERSQRAGGGNRTHNNSLEGWGNTILQRPQVGAAGLEPATSASQTQRASICATPRFSMWAKYTAFGLFRQGYVSGGVRFKFSDQSGRD
jgi:hypothetical protein